MRNMSFALTMAQIRDRTKTVTRRRGVWWSHVLRHGDLLCAVEKSRGIKKGALVRLGVIRVVSVRVEELCAPCYWATTALQRDECAREGFPNLNDWWEFERMFIKHMGGRPQQLVTRIEFDYVAEARA